MDYDLNVGRELATYRLSVTYWPTRYRCSDVWMRTTLNFELLYTAHLMECAGIILHTL